MFNKILKIAEANRKIDSQNKEISELKDKIKGLRNHLSDSDEYGQKLRGELAERDIQIKTLDEALVEASEENELISEQALEATAQAAEIVASIGINDPIPVETSDDKSNSDLLGEFTNINDPAEKMEFYKKHRDKLLNLK